MGLPCVILAKVATGVLTRHILSWLCALLGIPCVCVKRVSHVTSSAVHHNSGFNVLTEVSKAEDGFPTTHVQSMASTLFHVTKYIHIHTSLSLLRSLSVSLITPYAASLKIKKAVQIFKRSSTKFGYSCQICILYHHGNSGRGRSTNFILCSWNIKRSIQIIIIENTLATITSLADKHLYSSPLVTKMCLFSWSSLQHLFMLKFTFIIFFSLYISRLAYLL